MMPKQAKLKNNRWVLTMENSGKNGGLTILINRNSITIVIPKSIHSMYNNGRNGWEWRRVDFWMIVNAGWLFFINFRQLFSVHHFGNNISPNLLLNEISFQVLKSYYFPSGDGTKVPEGISATVPCNKQFQFIG